MYSELRVVSSGIRGLGPGALKRGPVKKGVTDCEKSLHRCELGLHNSKFEPPGLASAESAPAGRLSAEDLNLSSTLFRVLT